MRLTLAVLPRMLERDVGVIVNVSSVGGRLGIIHESAYCASKFALCGWSEAMAVDLHGTGVSVKLIEPGPVDTEIWDQPDNDDPLYEGPKLPPEEVAEGIVAALGGERFEHYVPDMKAVVDFKNADIDTFIAGAASMAPAMKALVFGVPPEPFEVPGGRQRSDEEPGALARASAVTVPDPRPLHDDWVVTRPRLTGICGSDSKQILLDFGEGDADNAMAAFCSFPR